MSTATVTSDEGQRQNNLTPRKNSVLDYLAGLARRFADAFKSTRETSPALADNNSTSDRDPNVTSGTVAAVYGPSGASPSGSKASSDSLNSSPEGSQTPDGGQADGSFRLAGGNNSGKNGDSSAGNGNNSGDNSNFSGDNGFSPAGGPRQQGFLGKLAAITGQNERDLSVFERSTITCADGSWCAELRRDTYVTMAFVEIERIVVRAVNGIEYVLHMPFNSNDFRIVQAYPEAQRDRDPLALAIVKSRHTATASHPDTTLDKLKGPQPDTQVYAMSAPASKEKRSFDFKFNQSFSSSRKDLLSGFSFFSGGKDSKPAAFTISFTDENGRLHDVRFNPKQDVFPFLAAADDEGDGNKRDPGFDPTRIVKVSVVPESGQDFSASIAWREDTFSGFVVAPPLNPGDSDGSQNGKGKGSSGENGDGSSLPGGGASVPSKPSPDGGTGGDSANDPSSGGGRFNSGDSDDSQVPGDPNDPRPTKPPAPPDADLIDPNPDQRISGVFEVVSTPGRDRSWRMQGEVLLRRLGAPEDVAGYGSTFYAKFPHDIMMKLNTGDLIYAELSKPSPFVEDKNTLLWAASFLGYADPNGGNDPGRGGQGGFSSADSSSDPSSASSPSSAEAQDTKGAESTSADSVGTKEQKSGGSPVAEDTASATAGSGEFESERSEGSQRFSPDSSDALNAESIESRDPDDSAIEDADSETSSESVPSDDRTNLPAESDEETPEEQGKPSNLTEESPEKPAADTSVEEKNPANNSEETETTQTDEADSTNSQQNRGNAEGNDGSSLAMPSIPSNGNTTDSRAPAGNYNNGSGGSDPMDPLTPEEQAKAAALKAQAEIDIANLIQANAAFIAELKIALQDLALDIAVYGQKLTGLQDLNQKMRELYSLMRQTRVDPNEMLNGVLAYGRTEYLRKHSIKRATARAAANYSQLMMKDMELRELLIAAQEREKRLFNLQASIASAPPKNQMELALFNYSVERIKMEAEGLKRDEAKTTAITVAIAEAKGRFDSAYSTAKGRAEAFVDRIREIINNIRPWGHLPDAWARHMIINFFPSVEAALNALP
ncbi:MAG: hypothetical protein FGM27_04840 [Candidatus Omnitrophica bacterium]|nr:hypothetical protein [Candidatus Omnitrophota bacterium]